MSKPMMVTLPFILLLLDYWPLRRLQLPVLHGFSDGGSTPLSPPSTFDSRLSTLWPLLLEKLPFVLLTLIFSGLTYLNFDAQNYILSGGDSPWELRLANIPISYVQYLFKTFWPVNLAALYPWPAHWNLGWVFAAVALLAVITIVAVFLARSAPYFVTGWFFFAGSLVPVIGVFPLGPHCMADRYTYLPSVGLFAALVWGAAELASRWRLNRALKAWSAAAGLAACAALCWKQVGCWRDSSILWAHCLAVNSENYVAHHSLGQALQHQNRLDDAIAQYREALRLRPSLVEAEVNLGMVLAMQGRTTEATNCFAEALRRKPDYAPACQEFGDALLDLGDFTGAARWFAQALRSNRSDIRALTGLGRVLSAEGRSDEAMVRYREAAALDPTSPEPLFFMGVESLKQGRVEEALASLTRALTLNPGSSQTHIQVAQAHCARHEPAEAIAHYREALRLEPASTVALNNLAWLLATQADPKLRNASAAVGLAERACKLSDYRQTAFIGTLAAAYAEAGQFEKAVETAQKACDMARAAGETNLLSRNQELLLLYKNRQPYREPN